MSEQQIPLTVQWNQLALEAIRCTKTSPPLAARALAMVHTAMYDAWSVYNKCAISTTTAKYIKRLEPDECGDDDKPKAISYAAYKTLTYIFWLALPSEKRTIFRELMCELKYDPDDASYDTKSPQGIGNLVAKLTINYRKGDEANEQGILYFAAPWSDFTGYKPVNAPQPEPLKDVSRWYPLQVEGKTQKFLAPHWPLVKPFALEYAWQFRPAPPLNAKDNASDFRKQAEEIFAINESLTDEQKLIAAYWADGPGSYTTAGHWCEITQYIATKNCPDYSEGKCVRLFFAVTNALLDVSIACWESKRKFESARPLSVIRELLGKDGWNSYVPSPPFPAHVSAHSAFSMAAATILQLFTGSDELGAVGILEKGKSPVEPGLPAEDMPLPEWPTFTAAAKEAGQSRLYGGVQFKRGNEDGQKLGQEVAKHVWKKVQFYFNDK